MPSEPAEPTGGGFPEIFQTGKHSWPFQTVDVPPPHAGVVEVPTGKIVVFKMQLHPWVGTPAI